MQRKELSPLNQSPRLKAVIANTALILCLLLLLELACSFLLLREYRNSKTKNFWEIEISRFSTIQVLYALGTRLGVTQPASTYEYSEDSSAGPFYQADPLLGYRAAPGEHVRTLARRIRNAQRWEKTKIRVRILPDGSRWTGDAPKEARRTLYVLGESYTFGVGVNNEHTFSYLLQQARKDIQVKLFALGGYSIAQAYLKFHDLKKAIRPGDAILIGYTDILDPRTMLTPNTMRVSEEISKERPQVTLFNFKAPRAELLPDNSIKISYLYRKCSDNPGYCGQKEPSRSEMTAVTASLINNIAQSTSAQVILLHVEGSSGNPLFAQLDKRVKVLSVLPEDFDYSVRDDIMGIEPHPGPVWHYAVHQKVLSALADWK